MLCIAFVGFAPLTFVRLGACAEARVGACTHPAHESAQHSWPFARFQIGLTSQPGTAGALGPLRLRYQYLAGGVNTGHGWTTWNPNGSFASLYVAESEAHHVVPVFSYYQIRQSLPGANVADEASADLGNLANASTMSAYFADLREFFKRAAGAHGPVVLHLEPDLFGYIEQHASGGNAATVPADVAASGLSGLPQNAAGFAQAVLALRDQIAPNVLVGYPISIWGTGLDIHFSHPSDAQVDQMAAKSAAFYRSLHANFDLSFTEVSDRDSGYASVVNHESGAAWRPVDFARDLRFLAGYHRRVPLPIVMWQIPLGNTMLDNTPYRYRDNKVQWLLGPDGRAHLEAYVRAGLVALLFGGGQPSDTDTAHDGGYFTARARAYYRAGALPLA